MYASPFLDFLVSRNTLSNTKSREGGEGHNIIIKKEIAKKTSSKKHKTKMQLYFAHVLHADANFISVF